MLKKLICHTRTSIAVDNNLKNDNFIEKNLRNILKGKNMLHLKTKSFAICQKKIKKIKKIISQVQHKSDDRKLF